MDYLKLKFSSVDIDAQEQLIALLSSYDFIGFEQEDDTLLAFAETDITADVELKSILEQYTVEKSLLPQQNWNKQWEESFEPFRIGDKIAIRADFHQPIDAVEFEIVITPKMSFGTGHHATTQLMLEQMSKLALQDSVVFDYGTGTGVLAIYAALKGARNVIANDIDPWSIENATENMTRNACADIAIRLGGIDVVPEGQFDIILANINLNVLKEDMAQLFEKLQRPGKLVVSGILKENAEEMLEILEQYTYDNELSIKNDWLCITSKVS